MTISKNNWPLQKDARKFYGEPGNENNLVLVKPPFSLFFEKQKVSGVRCHRLVANSLVEIFAALLDHYKTQEALNGAHVSNYSGCFNNRNIRGGSSVSLHSYGAALDFDAEHNPMSFAKGAGFFTAQHPIVQFFKAGGWVWGGDWNGRRDPMHFQAARV